MMKKSRVILMVLVAVVLAAGTVFERYRGAEWVADHFYGSWWFAVLMGLVAVGSLMALSGKRKVESGKRIGRQCGGERGMGRQRTPRTANDEYQRPRGNAIAAAK